LSKSEYALLNNSGIEMLKKKLLPLTFLITPNLYEAEILSGIEIKSFNDVQSAAKIILRYGCKNVMMKGGHFSVKIGLKKGTDILYNGKDFIQYGVDIIKKENS